MLKGIITEKHPISTKLYLHTLYQQDFATLIPTYNQVSV